MSAAPHQHARSDQDLQGRRGRRSGAARRLARRRRRRVRRADRPIGIGQVDVHAPARMPRPADRRPIPVQRSRRGALSNHQLARLRNREIGFVFQGFNLLPRTSALENVELAAAVCERCVSRGSAGDEPARRSRRSAWATLLRNHPNQMSGGQQQRVAIARALVNNPSLLLADEPTGNLDSRTSIEVMEIFQRLNVERGLTIVLVTHEHDIAEYATRIVSFRDGRVRTDQPVASRRSAASRPRGAASRGRGCARLPRRRYMSPLMTCAIAIKALRRNAMRTALTALGMIIGVAAVIVMVAIGSGAQASIEAQIRSAGSNLVIVSARVRWVRTGAAGSGRRDDAHPRGRRRHSRGAERHSIPVARCQLCARRSWPSAATGTRRCRAPAMNWRPCVPGRCSSAASSPRRT